MRTISFRESMSILRPDLNVKLSRQIGIQIAKMIYRARLIKGFTQGDMAEICELKQPAIARMESGKVIPSLKTLEKMATLMDSYLIAPRFAFVEEYYKQKNKVFQMSPDSSEEEFFIDSNQTTTINWQINSVVTKSIPLSSESYTSYNYSYGN